MFAPQSLGIRKDSLNETSSQGSNHPSANLCLEARCLGPENFALKEKTESKDTHQPRTALAKRKGMIRKNTPTTRLRPFQRRAGAKDNGRMAILFLPKV
jgi:hypothetical protein